MKILKQSVRNKVNKFALPWCRVNQQRDEIRGSFNVELYLQIVKIKSNN